MAEVAAGRFREDLFYRLHVIPIEMPSLREREDDPVLLARHFLARYANDDGKAFDGFTPEAEDVLLRYNWPGNIRELQNVIRNIVVLGQGPTITADALPAALRGTPERRHSDSHPPGGAPSPHATTTLEDIKPLEDVIDQTIHAAIERCAGSIPRAAAALKVSPSTIYRRLQAKAAN
jgi:two-component system, repressor protein LuxO